VHGTSNAAVQRVCFAQGVTSVCDMAPAEADTQFAQDQTRGGRAFETADRRNLGGYPTSLACGCEL
jgi:hypothetical protein